MTEPTTGPDNGSEAPLQHEMSGADLADKYTAGLEGLDVDVLAEEEALAEETEAAPGGDEEQTTDDAPDTPAEPKVDEGEGAEAVARPPAIKFRMLDDKGVEIAPAKGVMVEIDVKGEPRQYPLDVAIRLARQGIAASRLHEDYAELHQRHETTMARLPQLRQLWDEEVQYRERLLTDDAFYDQERQAFEKKNTPEARLAAREAQDATERRRAEETQQLTAAAERFRDEVIPVYEQVVGPYAKIVDPQAILDRVGRLTKHLLTGPNGTVPAHSIPEVKRILEGPVAEWLESEAVRRDAEARSIVTTKKEEVAKAVAAERERTTKDKKAGIAGLKPSTARRAPGAPTRTSQPPRTAAESVANSLTKHLDAMLPRGG